MAANTAFRIAELDFQDIKTNLKDYLRSQSAFSDYDFDGSGMNVLLDVLALNTHYMAYYLNQVGSEMFLDSALLRNSIISKAKMLGYVPTSRRSASAIVNILVTPPNGNTTGTLTLPKYSQFQSEAIDGVNYGFITLDSYNATKNLVSNTFTFSNVSIYEGEHLSYSYTVDASNPTGKQVIPNANVDTSTLLVTVQNSSVDFGTSVFTLSDDITEIGANSQVYFLEASDDNLYSIYFGDDFLGKQLSNGNIVITNYVVSSGEEANYANVFTSVSSVGGFSNVMISTVSKATGGTEIETDDQIKFRAPIAFTAQNRAATLNDYYAVIPKLYPNTDQVSVWGGQDNDPIVYGKVFISIKPRNGFALTNIEKTNLKTKLLNNEGVVGITPEIVDPEYLYVLIDATIYFNQKKTILSDIEIGNEVRYNLLDYVQNNLGAFKTTLKLSRIQTLIDNTDNSIDNSDLSIYLQKQVSPALNASQNYTIKFNSPLVKGTTVSNKLYTYPSFKIFDTVNIERTSYIEETPLSDTGVSGVAVTAPGSDYTSPPTVTITGDGTGATAEAVIVNGKVTSINVLTPGSNYTIAIATISGGGGSGATATPILSSDNGTLRIYYFDDQGQKIIINDSIGTIDYINGVITLTNFQPSAIDSNPFYTQGILTFNALSKSQTVAPSRNTIIVVDTNNPIAVKVSATPV